MTSEYHNWSGPKISCLLTRWGPTESPAETPAPPKAKEEEKVPTTQTSGKLDMENGGCQTPCPFEGIWRVFLVVVSINVFFICVYIYYANIYIYDIYVSLLSIYILKYIEQPYTLLFHLFGSYGFKICDYSIWIDISCAFNSPILFLFQAFNPWKRDRTLTFSFCPRFRVVWCKKSASLSGRWSRRGGGGRGGIIREGSPREMTVQKSLLKIPTAVLPGIRIA